MADSTSAMLPLRERVLCFTRSTAPSNRLQVGESGRASVLRGCPQSHGRAQLAASPDVLISYTSAQSSPQEATLSVCVLYGVTSTFALAQEQGEASFTREA